jgi:hypothetical protein
MGTLDQHTRDHFEAFYLKSPRRRARVDFARRFLTVVDHASTPSAPPAAITCSRSERVRRLPAHQETSKPSSTVHQSRVRWPLLTAAASFLLVCGLLVNDGRWREGLNQTLRGGAAQDRGAEGVTRPLDDARHENAPVAESLERAALASSEPPTTSASSAPRATATGAISAAVLFPQTRSIGQPPTIRIPASGNIPFELRLESNDFTQYRASLKELTTSRIVWRSQPLYGRSNTGSHVSLLVPASLLEPQHYLFELAGVDRDGHETPVSSYAFHIDRR